MGGRRSTYPRGGAKTFSKARQRRSWCCSERRDRLRLCQDTNRVSAGPLSFRILKLIHRIVFKVFQSNSMLWVPTTLRHRPASSLLLSGEPTVRRSSKKAWRDAGGLTTFWTVSRFYFAENVPSNVLRSAIKDINTINKHKEGIITTNLAKSYNLFNKDIYCSHLPTTVSSLLDAETSF